MHSGVSTSSVGLENCRYAYVRMPSGLTKRCRVLKETSGGSKFIVIIGDEKHTREVSSRHLWFESLNDINGSNCVVCFASGLLLPCKHCGRRFHEECSSMPLPRSPSNSTVPTFTCRDCFFMLYASRKGMERSSSAKNSLFLIKEVKRYSTYAYRELRWDALYRYNVPSIYCYCGGPGHFSQQMVQCLRCWQWFHRACLHCLPSEREILAWDCFWYFKCAHCNGEHGEVIKQIPIVWPEILHLAIMNINGSKQKFCNIKSDILPWLEKNWRLLKPVKSLAYGFETEDSILKRLRADPARFQCALEVGGHVMEWRARCYLSGPLREDMDAFFPTRTPVSQEKLNSISFNRTCGESLPLLTLKTTAKLPTIHKFEIIYGNKERYKFMEKRLQSSRRENYNENAMNLLVEYRPDEDQSFWRSFPDPRTFLPKRLMRMRNVCSQKADTPPSRAKRKRVEEHDMAPLPKMYRVVDKSLIPKKSSEHSRVPIPSKSVDNEGRESCSERESVALRQSRKACKPPSPAPEAPKKSEKPVISEKRLLIDSHGDPVKRKFSSILKFDSMESSIDTDVKSSLPSEEDASCGKAETVEPVFDALPCEEDASCDKASTVEPTSVALPSHRSSESEEEEEEPSPPTLRPRAEKAIVKQQVAKKSGRPRSLLPSSPSPKKPSPPPSKTTPMPVMRECRVSLKNIRNWYEITGDQPPQSFASGSGVLRGIPFPSATDKAVTQPFCYRWETRRLRYSRAKVIQKGWPFRHATSTPMLPGTEHKKSAYEATGVATLLARRRQVPVHMRVSDVLKKFEKKSKSSPKKLTPAKELPPYSNAECDSLDDEFKEILLQWNLKLVRIGQVLPV